MNNEDLLKKLDDNQLCKLETCPASAEEIAKLYPEAVIKEEFNGKTSNFLFGTVKQLLELIENDIYTRWFHMEKIIIKDNILYSIRW